MNNNFTRPFVFLLTTVLLLLGAISCSTETVFTSNDILSFTLEGLEAVQPTITDTEVRFEIDFNTAGKALNVAELTTIVTHDGVAVSSPGGTPAEVTASTATITQNFIGGPVLYTVTAETGETRTYQVSVQTKPGTEFITTWNTSRVTVPVNPRLNGYNYNIDTNNDGFIDRSGITGDVPVTFEDERTLRISGQFQAINLGFTSESNKITDITQWGTVEWRSMEFAFLGCENLQVSATDTPDLSAVSTMLNMFRGAISANPDVRNWDTGNVTTMESMFSGATNANPDLSQWNISKIQSSNLGLLSIFTNSGLSRENYEKAFIRFVEHTTDPNSEGLSLPQNIDLGSVPVTFCSNAATQAKATLEANGWSGIGDRGVDCDL